MTPLRRTLRLFFVLTLLPVFAVACFDGEPEIATTQFVCETDNDCLSGYFCKKIPGATPYCAPVTELREVTYVTTDTASPSPDASVPESDTAPAQEDTSDPSDSSDQ
jgi:hypothetical protein